MDNLEISLEKYSFFQGFPREYIREIAAHAGIVQYKKGDILFREGESADKFYLVIKGRVSIETWVPHRGWVMIQTIEEGEMLGWSWLVPPYKYRFGARVLNKTEMYVFNGEMLRRQCEKDHGLGYDVMKRVLQAFIRRLEQTRLQLLDIYGTRLK